MNLLFDLISLDAFTFDPFLESNSNTLTELASVLCSWTIDRSYNKVPVLSHQNTLMTAMLHDIHGYFNLSEITKFL